MFKKRGLVLLHSAVDTKDLYESVKKLESTQSDKQVPGSPYFYKYFKMSQVQMDMLRTIEEATGLELYPTYNYMRKYLKGATLPKHKDRYECEISFTLCIGHEGNWPIYVQDLIGKNHKLILKPGDLLIYRGVDCLHWRDKYEGDLIIQGFCHYVNKNGPNAHLVFDPNSPI